MSELYIDTRAIFLKGEQSAFLNKVTASLSVSEAALLCDVSERSIRDWRREKFSMPRTAVELLARKSMVSIPKTIKWKSLYEHTSSAGKKGYAAVVKKYSRIPYSESARREAWYRWLENEGLKKLPTSFKSRPVAKPHKNVLLAELVGVFMGDGSLSKYQASVTLHHRDDAEYAVYVSKLIEAVFKVTPRMYQFPKKSALTVTVSRMQLVAHLHAFGLPIGNKTAQRLAIPKWIFKSRTFRRACMRGLMDTDGCVVLHSYKSKGKRYFYKKLQFSSRSSALRRDALKILLLEGISARESGTNICIDGKEGVKRYFEAIGTKNPKHLNRYEH